jgi:LysM repeat protein
MHGKIEYKKFNMTKPTFVLASIAMFSMAKAQYQGITTDQYVQKFAVHAVEEMEKHKIPASITLAQGLLETGGGQSKLAREGNNHFGIKCKENWTGKTMKYTDDAPNECFRVYDDPKDSYRDHSIFLTTRKHYNHLFDLDLMDYKGWAYGLKKSGYATNARYAPLLIKRIEDLQLYDFDKLKPAEVAAYLKNRYNVEVPAKNTPLTGVPDEAKTAQNYWTPINNKQVKIKNNPALLLKEVKTQLHSTAKIKYIVLPDDLSITDVSEAFNIDVLSLMAYNDTYQLNLKKQQLFYLEDKKISTPYSNYTSKDGETLYEISQRYALKLSTLLEANPQIGDEKLKAGQSINLPTQIN